MREIKFRVWNTTEKYFVSELEGLYIDFTGNVVSVHQDNDGGGYYDSYDKVHGDRIIMQFTGLHDKNGKEIYEGDIVVIGTTKLVVVYGVQDIGHDFQGIGFYTKEIDGTQGNIFGGDGIEVIGNIYEHSDLLANYF